MGYWLRQKAFLEKSEDEGDSRGMEEVSSPSEENGASWPNGRLKDSVPEADLEKQMPSGTDGHASDQHECAFCRCAVSRHISLALSHVNSSC
jgi:hypothetical protein